MFTLAEAARNFLARFDNPNTLKSYREVLDVFVRDFGPKRRLSDIAPEDLDNWHTQQRDRGISPITLASRTKTMKAFWNWCVKREYITVSPARYLVVKKRLPSPASKAIPSPVIDDMMTAVKDKRCQFIAVRDLAILALMTTYGARAGDVARLPISNINFRESWLVLHVKGDKDHRLPLPTETAGILAAWLNIRLTLDPDPNHDFIFVANRTTPGNRYQVMAAASVSTVIKRLSAQVSGHAYGPHSIRHWRGQSLADMRIPATVVRDILGHSDIKITLDHYYNQDIQRISAILDETELGKGAKQEMSKPKGNTTDVNFWRRSG